MRNCSSARHMNHPWPLSFEENYVWLGSGFRVEKAADQVKVQLWGHKMSTFWSSNR